ncbi:hypothetical protein P8452_73719 [Trifolium repens]|nr:hypothetical protein P8452_73719 [Trifolium repens]
MYILFFLPIHIVSPHQTHTASLLVFNGSLSFHQYSMNKIVNASTCYKAAFIPLYISAASTIRILVTRINFSS